MRLKRGARRCTIGGDRIKLSTTRPFHLFAVTVVASLFVFLGTMLLEAREAHAQARSGSTLHILTLNSDDAEEQAEALSVALRSRAREKLGGAVADSSPSLAMFTAALRCSGTPDVPCLQKIAEQLKTDRFVYGYVTRAGKGQLSAEIHLYTRGKPDALVKEVFSDNLKDQNDEYLRRMASRIMDRLTGSATTAAITVSAHGSDGTVFVDDVEKARLTKGEATFDLPAGRHVIDVRRAGRVSQKKTIEVTAGQNMTVEMPTDPIVEPPPERGGDNTRKILGWSLVGLGAVAGGFAIYEGIHYMSLKSDTNDFREANRTDQGMPSKEAICQAGQGGSATWLKSEAATAKDICDNYDSAKTASLLGIIGAGVSVVSLGVGTYLLVSDTKKERTETMARSRAPRTSTRLQILPYVGPRASGFDVRVVF